MGLEFKEACLAGAKMYRENPSSYVSGWFAVTADFNKDDRGKCINEDGSAWYQKGTLQDPTDPRAVAFCGVGIVAHFMKVDTCTARKLLKPFSIDGAPADESNESREVAIALLERAAAG